jgi:hypothetical protein
MQPIYAARQKGLTLVGFILLAGLICVLAIQAVRAFPALYEFYEIEKAIVSVTQKGTSPGEIRKLFDVNASLNNISAVTGQDLIIEKAGNGYMASVSYNAWINLFKNVNLVIQFTATSQPLLTRKEQ